VLYDLLKLLRVHTNQEELGQKEEQGREKEKKKKEEEEEEEEEHLGR
jgi:hypothetical protein